MKCYCGHDCARCLVYLSSHGEPECRDKAVKFYAEEFGLKVSPDEVHCEGGRAGDELVFRLCRGCPFRNCCHEKGINFCGECDSKCKDFVDYRERYVNKVGQKGQDT